MEPYSRMDSTCNPTLASDPPTVWVVWWTDNGFLSSLTNHFSSITFRYINPEGVPYLPEDSIIIVVRDGRDGEKNSLPGFVQDFHGKYYPKEMFSGKNHLVYEIAMPVYPEGTSVPVNNPRTGKATITQTGKWISIKSLERIVFPQQPRPRQASAGMPGQLFQRPAIQQPTKRPLAIASFDRPAYPPDSFYEVLEALTNAGLSGYSQLIQL